VGSLNNGWRGDRSRLLLYSGANAGGCRLRSRARYRAAPD